MKSIFLCLFCFAISPLLAFSSVAVTSRFEPASLKLGERGTYLLLISGTQSDPSGTLPGVEELAMGSPAVSKSWSSINGEVRFENRITTPVTPKKEGVFTMPSFSVEVEGKTYEVPAATLVVSESTEADEEAFLTFSMPKKVFLGQVIPLTVQLYLNPEVRGQMVSPFPVQRGDAFTKAVFSQKPTQSTVIREGREQVLLEWVTAVTALKGGTQSLSFEADFLLFSSPTEILPQRDLFPFDSFFDRSFLKREEITLFTPLREIEVSSLPVEGQPKEFTGGIGVFTVESVKASAKELHVGEPFTLTLEITGEGNFDRIQPPMLFLGDNWRSYTPKSEVILSKDSEYVGTKKFTYVLIPKSEEIRVLPDIKWNYFNLVTNRYVEETLPGEKIQVLVNQTSLPSTGDVVEKTTGLLPIQFSLRCQLFPFTPLFTKNSFWACQCIFLLFFLSWVFYRKYVLRLKNDSFYLQKVQNKKRLQLKWKEAIRAVKKKDTEGFFVAAQEIIRGCIGSMEALTLTDIEVLLRDREDLLLEIKEYFEVADGLKFGGVSPERICLHKAYKKLQILIKKLKLFL